MTIYTMVVPAGKRWPIHLTPYETVTNPSYADDRFSRFLDDWNSVEDALYDD